MAKKTEKKQKPKKITKVESKEVKEPEVRLDQTKKDEPGYGINITE